LRSHTRMQCGEGGSNLMRASLRLPACPPKLLNGRRACQYISGRQASVRSNFPVPRKDEE
ncbi:MAG: hypothetical protein ABID09_02225, partial [Candidatus Omnitrophota bacterium]